MVTVSFENLFHSAIVLEKKENLKISLYPFRTLVNKRPGARFSKAAGTFRARSKAIFSSSVSKNGEVHTLEAS